MKCLLCNKETKNPKFCSRSCATSNNNKTPKRVKQLRSKPCLNCGKKIEYFTSTNKIYCSELCRQELKAKTGLKTNRAIRNYLIAKFGNKCMICGLDANDWNGSPITLIVDHINGKSDNNSLDNVRIICPNCDCQLPTYKAKNKGNSTRKYYIIQK
jgi:5-methylcytosine-specific restriction endonuclease McrA